METCSAQHVHCLLHCVALVTLHHQTQTVKRQPSKPQEKIHLETTQRHGVKHRKAEVKLRSAAFFLISPTDLMATKVCHAISAIC